MYKFKDVSVYFIPHNGELINDEIRLAVVGDVEGAKYKTKSILPVSRDIFNPEYFKRYQRNSVMERLLGISFNDDKEFSLEDLQALEFSLQVALSHSFFRSFEVVENGTGDYKCMKKGDLLFQDSYKDFYRSFMVTESNRKYGVASLYHDFWQNDLVPQRSIITPTEVKTTQDQLPNVVDVSLTKGQSPYGVFPDRSKDFDEDIHDVKHFIAFDPDRPNDIDYACYFHPTYFDPRDVLECPFFTLEAHNKFLAKQKESETDDSNDKN